MDPEDRPNADEQRELAWLRRNLHRPGALAKFADILVVRIERTGKRIATWAERNDFDCLDDLYLHSRCGR